MRFCMAITRFHLYVDVQHLTAMNDVYVPYFSDVQHRPTIFVQLITKGISFMFLNKSAYVQGIRRHGQAID